MTILEGTPVVCPSGAVGSPTPAAGYPRVGEGVADAWRTVGAHLQSILERLPPIPDNFADLPADQQDTIRRHISGALTAMEEEMTIKYGLDLEREMQRGDRVAEVSIGRITAHREWLVRWRWEITWYQTMEGDHPGVRDRRLHLDTDFGYTRTFWGAAIEAARAVRRGRVQR